MQNLTREIITQASEGQIEAFEKIYQVASGFVWSVAFRVTSNNETAQDVVQDVFLNVYNKLRQFQFKSSFKTWLYRITVNAALNACKKQKKELGLQRDYKNAVRHSGSFSSAEERLEREERERLLRVLLEKLSPEQRTCIILREIEGLSYQEISEVLKININTVRSRLKRAREALLIIKESQVGNEL
jgi:RNA polymerase sigma-70 factor (ECF subfamily)